MVLISCTTDGSTSQHPLWPGGFSTRSSCTGATCTVTQTNEVLFSIKSKKLNYQLQLWAQKLQSEQTLTSRGKVNNMTMMCLQYRGTLDICIHVYDSMIHLNLHFKFSFSHSFHTIQTPTDESLKSLENYFYLDKFHSESSLFPRHHPPECASLMQL